MRLRLLAPLAVLLALDLGPRPASAQDALTLFERGRALLPAQKRTQESRAWRFADARIGSQPDAVGITLNLAECYRDLGKLASSYSTYRQAEILCKKTGEHERERFAHDGAAALEPRLAHLRVVVPALPGLVLHRDGEDLGQTALVAPFPVDAGDHRIELSAPGYRTWAAAVRLPSDGVSLSLEAPAPRPGREPALRLDSRPATSGWASASPASPRWPPAARQARRRSPSTTPPSRTAPRPSPTCAPPPASRPGRARCTWRTRRPAS